MENSIKQIITDSGASARISLGIINKLDNFQGGKIGKQLLNIENCLNDINNAVRDLEDDGGDVLFHLLSPEDQRKTLEEELLQAEIRIENLKKQIGQYYHNVTISDMKENLTLDDSVKFGRFISYKGSTISVRAPKDIITEDDFYSFIKRYTGDSTKLLMINGKITSIRDLYKNKKK